MPTLVSASEVLDYLGLPPTEPDQAIVIALADQVEALLLRQCGRERRPFQLAQTGRVERRDGTGRATLLLDYSVASLTSVKLGYDSAAPDETLVVNDQTKLSWAVGSNRLQRVDGGVFGWSWQPGSVHVTYNTEADLPAAVPLAILHRVGRLWNQRGTEGMAAAQIGSFSMSLLQSAGDDDPLWQQIVGAHRSVFA